MKIFMAYSSVFFNIQRPHTRSLSSWGFLTVPLLMIILTLLVKSQPQLTDCSTVTALVYTCSPYITFGFPEPVPGTPCCDAMTTMNMIVAAEPTDGHTVCRCMMALISTYSPNASAIAALPGLCGVSLGFIISPTTDCN
ncbi:hypothetical protein SAY86_016856 [Trapa natans]|uniref:Bifunctional inhibitor/plant lipid transfer protein/seed storage helical domain-containing protein n=1 Tax=Trapa natans TaxID=22666 RepID=A0AAN7LPH7_TRANT|nr:hypothetical protein SAY86_016856 [Trapa natans]